MEGIEKVVNRSLKLSFTPDAVRFCDTPTRKYYVELAATLAWQTFPTLTNLLADVMQDPDSEDSWIVMEIELTGTTDDILEWYNTYSRKWVEAVPCPFRYLVRVSFVCGTGNE